MHNATDWTLHPFNRTGHGPGPYKCTGYAERVHANGDGTFKPGSSCDVCGTGIRHVFFFRSSTGVTFKVGCDCAQKAGREYGRACRMARRDALWQAASAERKAQAEANRAAREAREAAALRAAHPDWFAGAAELAQDGRNDFARSFGSDMLGRLEKGFEPSERQLPMLLSLIAEHRRPVGGHVGKVGTRLRDVVVTYVHHIAFDGQWGTTRIFLLDTDAGERLVWKSSAWLGEGPIERGDRFTITATVKAHDERDGRAQTVITRARAVKVMSAVAA